MNLKKTEKAPIKKAEAPKTEAPKSTAGKPDLNKFLDEIKKRAFDIYQERQKTKAPGDAMVDWLKAEKDIKAKYKL